MKVEIINIGDELLIGQVENTNATWMVRTLNSNGFETVAVSVVGDSEQSIMQAVDMAFRRADIVILTGGLGPTKDDITKHTLCRYFNTTLVFSEAVYENVCQVFQKRQLTMNELTRHQADVPEKATIINNPVGTAPVMWFDHNDNVLISLPGVPFEMKYMMSEQIIPLLKERFGKSDYLTSTLICSGITESGLAIKLDKVESKLPNGISLAYLPSFGYIRLRLSCWDKSCKTEFQSTIRRIKYHIGEHIIATGDLTLEEIINRRFSRSGWSLSTAESCTGGNIARKIASVAGASTYFRGAVVAYDNSIKQTALAIPQELIRKHGAVSEQVASLMATHVALKMNTTASIAVSGIMGPGGGSKDKPVGSVWISTSFNNQVLSKLYHVGRSRQQNIERTTNIAMVQLLGMMSVAKKRCKE